jgi:hypothetical protein
VSRGSSVSIVSCYSLDGRGSIPWQRQRIFPLASASRPALGPTQPPVQWVPGALSPGVKGGRGVMLTTHPLLVPMLRNSRSYTSSHPDAPLGSVTGPLYTFLQLSLPGLEPSTVFGYVSFVPVLGAVLLSCLATVPWPNSPKSGQGVRTLGFLGRATGSYRTTEKIFIETSTQGRFFGVVTFVLWYSVWNKFNLCVVLLSCLVPELQETPLPGTRTQDFSRSFSLPLFSSWSFVHPVCSFWCREISMPSLVQICFSVLELEMSIRAYMHTYTQTHSMLYKMEKYTYVNMCMS